MNTDTQIEELERIHTVAIDEVTLTICAFKAGENEWELFIENSLGIKSIWTELFSSSGAAINAGFDAIKNEGVREFSSAEGFGYLSNN